MWKFIEDSLKKGSEAIVAAVDTVGDKTEKVVGALAPAVDAIAPVIAPAEVRKIQKLKRIADETNKNAQQLEDSVELKKKIVSEADKELAIAKKELEKKQLVLVKLMQMSTAEVVETLPTQISQKDEEKIVEKLQRDQVFYAYDTLNGQIEDAAFQQKKLNAEIKSIKREKTPLSQLFKEVSQAAATADIINPEQVKP